MGTAQVPMGTDEYQVSVPSTPPAQAKNLSGIKFKDVTEEDLIPPEGFEAPEDCPGWGKYDGTNDVCILCDTASPCIQAKKAQKAFSQLQIPQTIPCEEVKSQSTI